jgi:hypothetical protein
MCKNGDSDDGMSISAGVYLDVQLILSAKMWFKNDDSNYY